MLTYADGFVHSETMAVSPIVIAAAVVGPVLVLGTIAPALRIVVRVAGVALRLVLIVWLNGVSRCTVRIGASLLG